MEELPSNSHKVKNSIEKKETKVVEPVELSSPAKTVKKTRRAKIKESLFANADAREVGLYLMREVIIPGSKDLITDLINRGTERALYGTEVTPRSRYSRGASRTTKGTYTSYDRMAKTSPPWEENRRGISPSNRALHNFEEVVIADRQEAEMVLSRLDDLIMRFDIATVSDFYQLVGITGNYTDDKYGWNSLSSSQIVRVRDGYLIKLPPTIPLD